MDSRKLYISTYYRYIPHYTTLTGMFGKLHTGAQEALAMKAKWKESFAMMGSGESIIAHLQRVHTFPRHTCEFSPGAARRWCSCNENNHRFQISQLYHISMHSMRRLGGCTVGYCFPSVGSCRFASTSRDNLMTKQLLTDASIRVPILCGIHNANIRQYVLMNCMLQVLCTLGVILNL